jgi:glycosyltransferase involved in cell wall biosynthesis
MKFMRVALVYNEYDSVSGEKTFYDNMLRKIPSDEIEAVPVPIHQAPLGTLSGKLGNYLRYPLLSDTKKTLRKLSGRYDKIHFLNAALSPAGSSLGSPKIATTHFTASSYLSLSPPSNPFSRLAESAYCRYVESLDKPAFSKLDRLVACTRYQADYLEENYCLGNVSVIYPGIDFDYFQKLPKKVLGERTIAYLGRLHERSKGVSYLLKAMEKLDARLLIVGDGPDRARYERFVREKRLGKKVGFMGRLPFREKSIIQKSVSAVVMPSLYEVYGTVFAESLACGTPVVAFDMPFWKGLYDVGFFVEKTPDALAEGISRAISSKAAEKGLELAKKHDISNTVAAYRKLYGGE